MPDSSDDYKQAKRSIAITTSLGEDKLLLKSCIISERLGRPFVIKAELLTPLSQDPIDFLELIGKGVSIRWRMPKVDGGDEVRHFSGYISSFVQRPDSDGFKNYEATIVPWLWFLTRTADCRIFHAAMASPPDKMTVPGILEKVFKDHGFDDYTLALSETYRDLDHCIQYRETDFNFVSRLMEQDGIYYFFEHMEDGGKIKHKLKLVDAMGKHSTYPGYSKINFLAPDTKPSVAGNILNWTRTNQVQPGTYKVNDFDFKHPQASLLGTGAIDANHANKEFEIYDFPGNYADEKQGDHGDAYGKLRIEELRAQHDIVVGQSDCAGLACGCKFTLEGHGRDDQDGEYLLVATTYRCTAEGYKSSGGGAPSSPGEKRFLCDFTAIPADNVFRPARTTRKPRVHGPQTAIVVGKKGEEILTDEFGRIKVQFHWDRYSTADENTPCWVRVSQLWAGKNWGGVFLPRIGQEVIVEFLDGNPDRPIVTGAVYNGESKPPYTLPDKATVSTIKSNSSKGGQGFNEIRFEDKKGSEQVFMHAEKDHDHRVKNDAKEWIGKDRHLVVKANQRETVEADKHTHVKGERLIQVDGDLGTTAKSNLITKVTGNEHLKVDGNYVLKIGGNLHEAVTGNHHEKTTGDILLSGANAHVKSDQNAAVQAGMNVHIKGGMVVVIEAGMQLSLKAGASFIDIGPAGISISGAPLVNINTGGSAGSGSGAQAASPSSPNDPDAITDATEAPDAEAGSSVTKTKPTPPTPKKFSPSAQAMKAAAQDAAPLVDPPAPPSSEVAAAASGTASAAAANASVAAAAATSAATAAANAGATAAAAAASEAAAAANKASDEAKKAAEKAKEDAQKAKDEAKEEANKSKEEVEKAKEKAKEATDKAKEEADKAKKEAEKAKEEAQKAADKAKESAKEAAAKGTQAAKEAAEKAKEATKAAEDKAKDAEKKANEAEAKAKDTAMDAKAKANESAEKAYAASAAAAHATAAATSAAAAASGAAAKATADKAAKAATAVPSAPH